MRILSVSLVLGLLALGVRAQEGADAVTAQVPKKSPVAIRISSLDRVDALVKDWIPILKAFGMGAEVAPLEQMPASNFLFALSGLSAEMVDKTKPIYIGMCDEEPVVVMHPAAGAAWEGRKELREGAFAILRGGAVLAGESLGLQAEPRGTPTAFRVGGDLVLHVYLGDLVEQHKADIEQMAAMAAMQGAAGGLPESVRPLVMPMVTAVKNGVLSLDSLDYSFTWTGERLESEGFVALKEGSGFRNLLKSAGEPGSAELVRFLPKEAFMTFSANMRPDFMQKEMVELFEKAGGADMAKALMQVMSMGTAFTDRLSGRSAGAVNMSMMSAGVTMIYELKPDSDPKTLFDTIDFAKVNEAMAKIGIPLTYNFEKAVSKHGETDLHRMGMASDDPMMAMQLAMMQGYCAAENGHLFMAMSPTGEDDLKALIDRVRKGETVENPHAAAMARLGRGHNLGYTFNLGALKPMAFMLGMFGAPPDVMQAFQNIPDVLPLSTAITFPDGNIRWRGDWPVKEIAKVAESIQKAMGPGAGAPPAEPQEEEEDFE